jgi:hypothetical protein
VPIQQGDGKSGRSGKKKRQSSQAVRRRLESGPERVVEDGLIGANPDSSF